MTIWANAYAIRNRLSFDDMEKFRGTTPATMLNLNTFLPRQKDYDTLKMRMIEIVKRILIQHLPWLANYQSCAAKHIKHAYSESSAQKSQLVSTFRLYLI